MCVERALLAKGLIEKVQGHRLPHNSVCQWCREGREEATGRGMAMVAVGRGFPPCLIALAQHQEMEEPVISNHHE